MRPRKETKTGRSFTIYEQVYDNEWEPCSRREVETCCDCRLTHHVWYRIMNGEIQQKVLRDPIRTYAARRREGIHILRTKGSDKINTAYIAGFFDGEGSITIHHNYRPSPRGKSPNHTLQVSVGNTEPSIPKYLHQSFGGCLVIRPATGNWRQVTQWIVRSNGAKEFLKTVLPFLRQKYPQAELAIQFQESKPSYSRTRLTQSEIARRESFRKKIRILNGRNK
jgi:hypothetical protein